MKLIEWSQKGGYREAELCCEELENEELDAMIDRIGFDAVNIGSFAEVEEEVEIKVYYAKNEQRLHSYHALVDVHHLSNFGCGVYDLIAVSDSAELFALYMELVPLVRMRAEVRLSPLLTIAKKAFHAWHGHYAERVCHECDPEIDRIERDRAERYRAQRLEKERLARLKTEQQAK